MATRSSVPAAGRPFVHLSRAASDVPPNQPDDPDGDDADEEEDDEDDGETDENGKKTKKSKKTKKAEDDSDEDDDEKSDARAIRRRERARVATILNSAAGKRFPDAAKHLAFHTATPRWRAVRLLKGMSKNVPQQSSNSNSLRDRMAGVRAPDVGSGGDGASSPTLAEQIILAAKKARGEI